MARKSEIRQQAKAALDALLAAADAPDEETGGRRLGDALERLSEAAGVLPKGKSLREVAKGGGQSGEVSLSEALAYATGQGRDNPALTDASLLGRLGIDRDELGG